MDNRKEELRKKKIVSDHIPKKLAYQSSDIYIVGKSVLCIILRKERSDLNIL